MMSGLFGRLAARMGASTPREAALAADAGQLAARLPALVVQAERIAATVSAGQHGRRRAGPGETFWQYRPALPGEPVTRIDWRQSARSHRAYIRETEAETAQTVLLWCDLSPSMRWRSSDALPEKQDRALLLVLALGTLLQRGGERVRLLTPEGPTDPPPGSGSAAEKLALAFSAIAKRPDDGRPALPHAAHLPRHARLVIAGDFLCPEPEFSELTRHLASRPAPALLAQIVDPAESTLPYAGRVQFLGTEQEAPLVLPQVETLRQEYETLFAAREARLRALAGASGHGLIVHRTDAAPMPALLALHEALSGGMLR